MALRLTSDTSDQHAGIDLAEGEAHLWLIRLDNSQREHAGRGGLLDAHERAQAASFRFDHHRAAYVSSHAAMRLILARYVGLPPREIEILQGGGRKPRLANAPRPLEFNLSHSDGYALLGMSHHPIGVDIEAIRNFSDRDAIVRANFSRNEIASLDLLPDDRRWDGFFACWTRKEAYVKALGVGLAGPLGRFTVSTDPAGLAELVEIDGSAQAAAGWSMWGQKVTDKCWAAAAVDRPGIVFHTMTLA